MDIKAKEKEVKELRWAIARLETTKQVNDLLAQYAKRSNFGQALDCLAAELEVSRATIVSWACGETSPQSKQKEKLAQVCEK